MIQYVTTNNPAECCGCRGCEQICSHHALTMQEDEEGFLYPVLNEDACVNCGLCEKVCPMTHGIEKLYNQGQTIAVQNLNKEELFTSSSGGVFVAIANEVISKNGIVYGAAFENGPILCHQRITTIEGIERLKGSKYLQLDIRNTYQLVKHDLTSGKSVYFVGTPCQIAGLRLFLKKDYENLLVSDLVCHGTPSNKIFRNTISHLEKKTNGTFNNYSFRDNRIRGWSCSSSFSLEKGNREVLMIYSKDMDAYFNAFINGDLMRMSCYSCPFARFERTGDITLADYWGVRKYSPSFPQIGKGVSLMIINSEKGKKFFKTIYSQFNVEEISKDDATFSNSNLVRPTILKPNRKESYLLAMNNYEMFVDKYYEGSYYVNKLKVYIEYFIRRSPLLFCVISFLKKKFV